jgi:hypothetical protein
LPRRNFSVSTRSFSSWSRRVAGGVTCSARGRPHHRLRVRKPVAQIADRFACRRRQDGTAGSWATRFRAGTLNQPTACHNCPQFCTDRRRVRKAAVAKHHEQIQSRQQAVPGLDDLQLAPLPRKFRLIQVGTHLQRSATCDSTSGVTEGLSAGWSYDFGQRFAFSSSPTRGSSLVLARVLRALMRFSRRRHFRLGVHNSGGQIVYRIRSRLSSCLCARSGD